MTKRERAYQVLCEVLVNARNEAGLTQRQLAQRLGRAHTFIAKVELGERRLDVIEFIDLAHALRVDPMELFARVARR